MRTIDPHSATQAGLVMNPIPHHRVRSTRGERRAHREDEPLLEGKLQQVEDLPSFVRGRQVGNPRCSAERHAGILVLRLQNIHVMTSQSSDWANEQNQSRIYLVTYLRFTAPRTTYVHVTSPSGVYSRGRGNPPPKSLHNFCCKLWASL